MATTMDRYEVRPLLGHFPLLVFPLLVLLVSDVRPDCAVHLILITLLPFLICSPRDPFFFFQV